MNTTNNISKNIFTGIALVVFIIIIIILLIIFGLCCLENLYNICARNCEPVCIPVYEYISNICYRNRRRNYYDFGEEEDV